MELITAVEVAKSTISSFITACIHVVRTEDGQLEPDEKKLEFYEELSTEALNDYHNPYFYDKISNIEKLTDKYSKMLENINRLY